VSPVLSSFGDRRDIANHALRPLPAKPCAGGSGTIGLAFDGLLNDQQQCQQQHHGIMNGQATLR
jgi:hypothetical protein